MYTYACANLGREKAISLVYEDISPSLYIVTYVITLHTLLQNHHPYVLPTVMHAIWRANTYEPQQEISICLHEMRFRNKIFGNSGILEGLCLDVPKGDKKK